MHTMCINEHNWLAILNEKIPQEFEAIEIEDERGHALCLQWFRSDIRSKVLGCFKKEISELASQITADREVEFLKAFPEGIQSELFLKPAAHLFENGYENVDWNAVHKSIQATVKSFYTVDLSTFGDLIKPLLDDLYFFAALRDQETQKLIGFFMASATPHLAFGTIKVISWGVDPSLSVDGINLFVKSLLQKAPMIKNLFQYVRPTSMEELAALQKAGFKEQHNGVFDPNHAVNMKYLTLMNYIQPNSTIGTIQR